MTSTDAMRLTIHPARLRTLLASVLPFSPRGAYDQVPGVRLARQGDYLVATATDRYTVGIARARLSDTSRAPADGWSIVIARKHAAEALAGVRRAPLGPEAAKADIQAEEDHVLMYGVRCEDIRADLDPYPSVMPLMTQDMGDPAYDAHLYGSWGMNARFLGRLQTAQVEALRLDSTASMRMWGRNVGDGLVQLYARVGGDFIATIMGLRLNPSSSSPADLSDWSGMA